MVDDFMVYVDRLISSACFESANEGFLYGHGSAQMPHGREGRLLSNNGCSGGCKSSEGQRHVGEGCSIKGALIECRICQEEDEEKELEAPCACNGTLKFAHRKCIQRWCDKKGDITCEICNQVYAPNYSILQTRDSSDGLAIDIRNLGLHGTAPVTPYITPENRNMEHPFIKHSNAAPMGAIIFLPIPGIPRDQEK